MSKISLIAMNTFKELIRNRVLYAFLLFAIFLVILTVAIGQLSYTEQLRLTMSLGLASIHMCIMGLTIFLGGSLIYKEIERLTILTLLSRPIGRSQFLLGKYFGFLSLIVSFCTGFYIVFTLNLLFLGFDFRHQDLMITFIGIGLEAITLLAITIFFSTFCASFLSIIFSIGLFIVGHWSSSIPAIELEGTKTVFYHVIHFAKKILPNFEHLNWRLNAIESFVTPQIFFVGFSMALLWSCIFLISASVIFRSKDFA